MTEFKDIWGPCPHCAMEWAYEVNGERYTKVLGLEYPEKYDGVWEWQCPGCQTIFPRMEKFFKREAP